jgi:putative transposase
LVENEHPKLSMRKQCKLLGISRSTVQYVPVAECEEDRKIKRALDELYMRDPCLGIRKIVLILQRDYDIVVNRKRVARLREEMGLRTNYREPRTSVPNEAHKKYPYLLKDYAVTTPNAVWCSDITYVPMSGGNAFLCVVMDWATRKVLGWAVSNTMDVSLCIDALKMAYIGSEQMPDIMNTDQGSQFTSEQWVAELEQKGVRISMDGRGRYLDNIFIERLWRSVKYENIYIRNYESIRELRAGLAKWFKDYNDWRPHDALGGLTPEAFYNEYLLKAERAA